MSENNYMACISILAVAPACCDTMKPKKDKIKSYHCTPKLRPKPWTLDAPRLRLCLLLHSL